MYRKTCQLPDGERSYSIEIVDCGNHEGIYIPGDCHIFLYKAEDEESLEVITPTVRSRKISERQLGLIVALNSHNKNVLPQQLLEIHVEGLRLAADTRLSHLSLRASHSKCILVFILDDCIRKSVMQSDMVHLSTNVDSIDWIKALFSPFRSFWELLRRRDRVWEQNAYPV